MASATTSERTNYARLCQAVIDICTEVLRHILKNEIDPKGFRRKLLNYIAVTPKKQQVHFSKQQDNIIQNIPVDGYVKCDITLLYTLIRNLCSQKTVQPTRGWFTNKLNNSPRSSDTKVGDDIERIQDIRNCSYAHISKACVSTADFNSKWNILEAIMIRMTGQLGFPYDQELAKLKSIPMDDQLEAKYIKLMENLKQREYELTTSRADHSNLKRKFDVCEEENENLKRRNTRMKMRRREKKRSERKEITKSLIEKHRKDESFVITTAVESGVAILKKTGVLIYTGCGGDGKTENAYEIMSQMVDVESDTNIVKINDSSEIKEWEEFVDPNTNMLLLLDDCLGKTNADSGIIGESGKHHWEAIYSLVEKGILRVIMTVRSHIMEKHSKQIEGYQIFSKENIVNLSSKQYKLSDDTKLSILKNQLRINNINICDERKEENFESDDILDEKSLVNIHWGTIFDIIGTQNPGFPQSCFMFSRIRKYTRLGVKYFRSPSQILIDEINKLRLNEATYTEKLQYCILCYMLVKGGSMDANMWEWDLLGKITKSVMLRSKPRLPDLNNAVENIIGKFIYQINHKLEFIHQTVLEATALSFGKYEQKILIKYCSNNFIEEFIRAQDYIQAEGEVVLLLQQENYAQLTERILLDFQEDSVKNDFCNLSVFDDERFVRFMRGYVDGKYKYKKLIEKHIDAIFNSTLYFGKIHLAKWLHEKFTITDTSECLFEARNHTKTMKWLVDNGIGLHPNSIVEALSKVDVSAVTCMVKHEAIQLSHIERAIFGITDIADNDMIQILFEKIKQTPKEQNIVLKLLQTVCMFRNCEILPAIVRHPLVDLKHVLDNFQHIRTFADGKIVKTIIERWKNLEKHYVLELLYGSCVYGNDSAVNVITKTRHDVITSDTVAESLMFACVGGQDKIVNLLKNEHFSESQLLKPTNKENLSYLHIAAFFGRYNVFRQIKDLGLHTGEKTLRTRSRLSVLKLAMLGYSYHGDYCTYVNVGSVSKVLNEYCERYKDVQLGCLSEYVKILEFLVQDNETDLLDIEFPLDDFKNSIVHLCVVYNSTSIIKLLCNRRYNPSQMFNLQNGHRYAPIHIAALLGRSDIFHLLKSVIKLKDATKDLEDFVSFGKQWEVNSVWVCMEQILLIFLGKIIPIFR